MNDTIWIEQLEVTARVGVPDAELAKPQRLMVSLTLFPRKLLTQLGDDIAKTVDYFAVCETVKRIAAERPRRLIETLAEEIAQRVLAKFAALESVEIELRKFILPDTKFVAIRLRRSASH